MIKTKVISSLEKVFPEGMQEGVEIRKLTGCKGETVSFQIAGFWPERERVYGKAEVKGSPEVVSGTRVRQVDPAPSEFPWHLDGDEGYLKKEPGLYPEILREISSFGVPFLPGQWKSLWVTVDLPEQAGDYELRILLTVKGDDRQETEEIVLDVHVVDVELLPSDVRHTEWFHGDCLADYYDVEVFSEEHWKIMENFLSVAAKRSCDTILTPLFTPPLDTRVGGERRTIQLTEVSKSGTTYRFGFEKLERWVEMCRRCGFTHFEMSHLFTQWGAKAAPKIMVEENGVYRRMFGWDTPATGEAYADFLRQFLPALTKKLKEMGLQDRVYFHISDEPGLDDRESYEAARNLVKPYLDGFELLDALSDYPFFETGLLEQPVCGIDHLKPFLEKRPEKLWTYYCNAQKKGVTNRFFAQHSGKTRILGVLLYQLRMAGFLHWGYNFYNAQYSLYPINPYLQTDAGGAFPSGDSFLVYPGKDGIPEESLRLMLLAEAFSDLRLLYTAEAKIGRERVEAIICRTAGMEITEWEYPYDPEFFLHLREHIFQEIIG